MPEVLKKRVSSLAKQYEVTSELLLSFLHEAGFGDVKTASSMIDQETFRAVKPLVAAEKERREREEMIKSGKKIPMKAVLKKAPPLPPAPPIKKVELQPIKPKIEEPVVQSVTEPSPQKSTSPEGINKVTELFTPPVEQAKTSSNVSVNHVSEASVTPNEPVPVATHSVTPIQNDPKPTMAIPESETVKTGTVTPEKTEIEVKKPGPSDLKVSVEKPNAEFLARLAKSQQKEQRERFVGRGPNQGYSGQFGRVPSGAPAPRTGAPSRPGDRGPRNDGPRDVFAQRAHDAGVATTGFGRIGTPPTGFPSPAKPDRHSDHKDKPKTGTTGAGTGGGGGGGGGGAPPKGKSRGGSGKRKTREQIEQELGNIHKNVNKVMASLSRTAKPKFKGRKEDGELEESGEKKILEVAEFISIGELAGLMKVMPNKVIAKCMEMGVMVTINQRLDHETIALIADDFGFEVRLMEEYEESLEEIDGDEDQGGELQTRAPIVTVMGHVDHGKTSVLDYIRKTNVIAGEAGGITQHIGAYHVETPQGPVCFLDTPGHEAFSAMRARGAIVTDVVLLVVAADSMVMPQTKESIQLAKNANCQIVVAINKCDLPTANPDKIKTQLSEAGVEVEEWGGKVPCVHISARKGDGMDKLLEILAISAELMELKGNKAKRATGTILESRLDKGKGAVATLLVQNGTLRVGDAFVAGIFSGKVRSILDERGNPRESAGPSSPVQILGLDGAPQAGDTLTVVETEKEAREVAARRRLAAKDRELRSRRHITLDQLYDQIKQGEFHELNVIIKADMDGSVEAIGQALERLSTPEVKVNIIAKAVGTVTENDVHLAATADAIIVAFHVLPNEFIRNLAEQEGVSINSYRVIYEVVDEVRAAMEGMLTPEIKEEVAGEAEIKQIFVIPKVGVIAGSVVVSGVVERDAKVRLYRDGIEVSETKVISLRRHKDDASSVKSGLECGIGLEGIKDIKEGDVLAFFKKVEVQRKLSAPIHA